MEKNFNNFCDIHKQDKKAEVNSEILEKFSGKIPEDLVVFWKQFGRGSFSNGLLWFVDPEEYSDTLSDWVSGSNKYVFARSGFGDLIIWTNKGVQYIHVHFGKIVTLMPDFEFFANVSLVDSDYIKNVLLGDLFKKATKKLGKINFDECFTFVPALAMGGVSKLENVTRVKMKEQLAFLSQLHGKLE